MLMLQLRLLLLLMMRFLFLKEIGLRVSFFPSFLEVREFPHDVKVATLLLYNNETAATLMLSNNFVGVELFRSSQQICIGVGLDKNNRIFLKIFRTF